MQQTISFRDIVDILKKRIYLIISIALAAVLISGVASYYLATPKYKTSTQLLINQKNNDFQILNMVGEIQANLQLINTYSAIIKSPVILDDVIRDMDLDMTPAQLNRKINVQNEQDSQVLNVSVEDPNPYHSAEIANSIASVFQDKIKNIMKVDNVTILAKAEVGEQLPPIEPKPGTNMAIGLIAGLILGMGAAFLLHYFDNTIKSEEDVERILGLPVLGVVTNIEESRTKKSNKREKKAQIRGETIGS